MPLFSTNRGYADEERLRIIVNRLFESLGKEKSIWEYYNEMAAVEDNIREVEWRDLADTVLVFDGLFAAFLSAFLVFLIPQLQANSTDVAMDVLIHISQQLSNSTTPAFEPTAFQVSSNAAAVNMLFFLSLALVLIDAFLAMLVKGWLQEFDRGWRKYTVAHLRAQERERRLQELERWKLHELVALLPILIQGSLLLFCIGLLVLIFPLHLPSGILCSLAFVSVVGFYVFTAYVSVVNNYAPFSSPVSRLLARALAVLRTWHIPIADNAQRLISAISFHNRPPIPPQGRQADVDVSDKTTQPLPADHGLAQSGQPHNHESVEKSKIVPRSRSGIDPQTHVHVLERLVTTTDEVVENIPIFLELLDQPVKDLTLWPLNVEKWNKLLRITLGLLRDQSIFSVSAACTLARAMMICYNHESPDDQLSLTLQHHLGSWDGGDERSRMPLNVLFSSYIPYWLGYSYSSDLWRTIAFLEPSDSADAELLWIVNTFHRSLYVRRFIDWEDRFGTYIGFFAAVLTYVSSTEQSRRSKVPLTAAVIYALHNIGPAFESMDGRTILPGDVSTSEPVLMTFCQVDGIDALDPWSEECIQIVKDVLQWDWPSDLLNGLRLSLIAALYIDSTKQAHARSTFEDLLKGSNIVNIKFAFSGAYDGGNLAIYSYMAHARKPLPWNPDPLAVLCAVIETTISEYSTLQLSGLHILEIALKYLHKRAASSPGWLKIDEHLLEITLPGDRTRKAFIWRDPWILLHLDTLFPPQPYLPPEDVEELEWSDTPAKVHIASARLDLYDSLAKAEPEGAKVPKPDPKVLRVFLWSYNFGVCSRTFGWCLDLATMSQSDTPGDTNSTRVFIPDTMGYQWVDHFVHVLCGGGYWDTAESLDFLMTVLVPKWTMLPSSWCHDFASALLLTVVRPLVVGGIPAYEYLTISPRYILFDEDYLLFLATLLELIKYSLTRGSIISLEHWLAQLSERLQNQDAHTQMVGILATRTQQLVEENLEFFAELPMASEWLEENLELFAELPMVDDWAEEILGISTELPMAGEWMDG